MQVPHRQTLAILVMAIISIVFGSSVADGHMRMGYKVTKPHPPRPHKPHYTADPIRHNAGLARY